jgi:hypothetical protein
MQPKFKEGDRVVLAAMPENGIFEPETATVLEFEGNETYMVEVDTEYRLDIHDDGLREVTEDQMEPLK